MKKGIGNGNHPIKLHSEDVKMIVHNAELMKDYVDTDTLTLSILADKKWHPRHHAQASAKEIVEQVEVNCLKVLFVFSRNISITIESILGPYII